MSVQNQFITFVYPAGPKDVIVTGDFCYWKKTTHLVPQSDGSFSLTMPLVHKAIKQEDGGNYFYFKFVVDDKWTIDSRYESKIPQNAAVQQPNNFVKIDDNSKRLSSFIPESVLPNQGNTNTSGKKRVRVKRKMRKNKNTGETSVLSEEQEFVDENGEQITSSSSTPLLDEDSQVNAIVIPTTPDVEKAFTKFEKTDDQKALDEKLNADLKEEKPEADPVFTIQPVAQAAPSLSLAGEPGVQIADPSNPVFNEIRNVDQKELNSQLNADLENENKNEGNQVKEITLETHVKTFKPNEEVSIQPVVEEKSPLTVAGEPGVQIADPANPAFTEIRNVDQHELNDKLNAQLAEENKEAEVQEEASVNQEPPVVKKEVKIETPKIPAPVTKPVKAPSQVAKPQPSSTKKSDGGCCVIC